MQNINKDLLALISYNLCSKDVVNLSQTCKRFYFYINKDKNIWLNLLKKDFSFKVSKGFYSLRYQHPKFRNKDYSNFYKTDFYGKSFRDIYTIIYKMVTIKIINKYDISMETLLKIKNIK